ncbi:hypothetical protein ElyMa_005217100 [Elysia marginata]|uniref:Uncharacterized protein n=1 Tax=Elysia marginata TaxID=1093978 RepID=A0AAV4JUP6_9GAST|nr:hypothetical protein ElyMa_005217100 [Elysia marginata]
MDDLRLATFLREGENPAIECFSQYYAYWTGPHDSAQRLQDLLDKENDLKRQFMAALEEKLILEGLSKDPQEWKRTKDAGVSY